MPRKNPLPPNEAAICARIKRVRESRGLTRIAFAREAGVDSTEVIRVEHLLAPVRFAFADKVCARFEISQAWIGEDEGPQYPYLTLPPRIISKVDPGELFSSA